MSFRKTFALVLLTVTGFAGFAQGADGPAPLNVVLPGFESPERPPYLLNWLKPEVISVVDPVTGELVFVDGNGAIVGRESFPEGFFPDAQQKGSTSITYFNADRSEAFAMGRDHRPGQTPVFQRVDPAAVPDTPDINRTAAGALHVAAFSTGKGMIVPSETAVLYDAQVLGPDTCGDVYVRIDERRSLGTDTLPLTSVVRFNPAGDETGRTEVAIDGKSYIGRGAVDVSDKGEIWSIVTSANGNVLRRAPIVGRSGQSSCSGVVGPADGESEATRNPVQRSISSSIQAPPDDGEAKGPADGGGVERGPTVTRASIVARAEDYLKVKWVLKPGNWQWAGIPNTCHLEAGEYWRRPLKFSQGVIGKTFSSIPYRWGGGDSPERFLARIASGKLAGDVCTCRSEKYGNCLVPESAGVDCSGFVSYAWGISKIGTGQFDQIADTVKDWSQAKPGDAFVRPGKHIILVKALVPGPVLRFRTIESTTDLACEGVCERVQRGSTLMRNYRLIRYRSAVE